MVQKSQQEILQGYIRGYLYLFLDFFWWLCILLCIVALTWCKAIAGFVMHVNFTNQSSIYELDIISVDNHPLKLIAYGILLDFYAQSETFLKSLNE